MMGELPSFQFLPLHREIKQKEVAILSFYVDCRCGGEKVLARGSPCANFVEPGVPIQAQRHYHPLAITCVFEVQPREWKGT